MHKVLQAALNYAERGFSVIPVKPDVDEESKKKPYVAWTPYQTRRATPEEIKAWWTKWPTAMIGIVTGEISGIFVIDCDNKEAYDKIQALLPDSFLCPIAKTPRGWHLWFLFAAHYRIANRSKVMPGVDIRTTGGYIIAPPSINEAGQGYEWLEGLSIDEAGLTPVPINLLKSFSLHIGERKEKINPDADSLQFLTLGRRDQDLYHVGDCLIRSGCKEDTARQVLDKLAKSCNPPFPENEAQKKIDSVLARCERKERNLTEDLRRWIDLTSAYFSLTEAYDPLQILTSQKNTVHQIMHRFAKEGYVERHPNKNGIYRRVDSTIEFMDFENADTENYIELTLPLGMHNKTKLFPKGVINIAGVSGMGKTLFALSTISANMGKFPIYYFNSEMSPEQLKTKLSYFPIPISEWVKGMKVVDDWDFHNISDKIQPDAFNVIDYLEPEGDKPYNIHGVISAIIRRMNKGTALITIQKKPGASMGTGGIYSIKAATLAVSLEWGKIEIVKNRNREADQMPSLNKINFEIHQGHKFVPQGGWYK